MAKHLIVRKISGLYKKEDCDLRFFIVLNQDEYVLTVAFNTSTLSCKIIDSIDDTCVNIKDIENSIYEIRIEELKNQQLQILKEQIHLEFPEALSYNLELQEKLKNMIQK